MPSSTPRKVKYAPKAPHRRKKAPKTDKVSDENDGNNDVTQSILRRFNENMERRGPRSEKKMQVAFGHGAASTAIRTYGKPKEGNVDRSGGSPDNGQVVVSPTGIAIITEGTSGSSVNAVAKSSQKIRKEYKEPWDYHRTYYPISLPLRRPYSGDPELLDEAEYGEATEYMERDDDITNSASELGLLEESEKVEMLFLQLPSNLPLFKREDSAKGKDVDGSSISLGGTVASATAKGKEKAGSLLSSSVAASSKGKERVPTSISSGKGNAYSKKGCGLEELPGGYMGKMLVYKSGTIKLKLGETLYDVSPGSSCVFAQDVVAINTVDKDCCVLGELSKRAVVTPDLDSLLDSVSDRLGLTK